MARCRVGVVVMVLALLAACAGDVTPTPAVSQAEPTEIVLDQATEEADSRPTEAPTAEATEIINLTGERNPATTPEPTPASVPTPITAPTPTTAATVNTAAVLRSGPGTNYPAADSAKQGTAVRIVARNAAGDWLQLASGLWIAAWLVTGAPEGLSVAANIPASPAPSATPRALTSTPALKALPTLTSGPAARACCKVCRNSIACGDSCIASNKQCHQPAGCACNG